MVPPDGEGFHRMIPTPVGVNRKIEKMKGGRHGMIPTPVGVNRWTHSRPSWRPIHDPHARGGEPAWEAEQAAETA